MYWGDKVLPINVAKEAIRLFVRSLPEGSKFNIYSFGSNFTSLFPESVDYTLENIDKAIEDVE